jgi:hypothetical protein
VIAGTVLVALGGPGPTLAGVPWLAITLLSGGGLAFMAAARAVR